MAEQDIEAVFPEVFRTPPDLDAVHNNIPSGVWCTGAPTLWNATVNKIDGTGIVVGVIDSGIDDSHPDLKGKVLTHNEIVTDPSGRNLHGTHVAGTIAANGSIKGVAPKAMLRDYRVFDNALPRPRSRAGAVTKAIRAATADKCDIINLSLGGSISDPEQLAAIKDAVAAGVVLVVAAGNEGEKRPAPQPSFPGNYPEVICVGAVNWNFRTGEVERAAFSNQNEQVDVAADGVNVFSTIPGGDHAELSGTSMATPHVAGFCALLLQKLKQTRPEVFEPTAPKNARVQALWSALMDNTVDIFEKGDDWKTGAGFVTLYPAIPKKVGTKWVIPGMSTGEPL